MENNKIHNVSNNYGELFLPLIHELCHYGSNGQILNIEGGDCIYLTGFVTDRLSDV